MFYSLICVLFLTLALAGCSNTYTVTRARQTQAVTKITGDQNEPAAKSYSISDGLILYRQGDAVGALANFKAAIANDSSNWLAHYYMGLISYESQQYNQALYSLNDALRFGPRSGRERAMIYVALGLNWEEQGYSSKAFQSYHTAINLDENSVTARDGLKRTAARTERD